MTASRDTVEASLTVKALHYSDMIHRIEILGHWVLSFESF